MNFIPGEKVGIRFTEHLSRPDKSTGSTIRTRNAEGVFIKMKTSRTAVVEVRTPLGIEERSINVCKITKLG